MVPEWIAVPAVLLVVGVATVTDLRHREVPLWLTVGGGAAGVLASSTAGWDGLVRGIVGFALGGLLLLPMVRLGGLGAGDALVLAAVGSWRGWPFVLWAAWWGALLGGVLALVALCRGKRSFAYVPALAVGTVLALLTGFDSR